MDLNLFKFPLYPALLMYLRNVYHVPVMAAKRNIQTFTSVMSEPIIHRTVPIVLYTGVSGKTSPQSAACSFPEHIQKSRSLRRNSP